MKYSQKDLFIPTFDYELSRSKRKSLVIYVKEGKVEVRAPLRTPERFINAFIREKTPWILKSLEDQRRRMRETLVIAQGRKVCFFGKPRIIQIIRAVRNKVEIDQHYLYIYTRDRSADYISGLFQKWLQKKAREYMATRTITLARELGVEHKLKDVVFRKTKTKWGHCSHEGNIQYNWLAMMAPKPVVDYLVAHETSHLKHMNHSARFWKSVESLCPDYSELRNWLGDNGHRLWLK